MRELLGRLFSIEMVVFALWLLPAALSAQTSLSVNRGLIFRSFEVDPVNRTSLDITEAFHRPIEAIEFELALNSFSSFGYLFRALAVSGSQLDFLYTPNDGGYFKVIVDGAETALNVQVKPEEVRRNYWRSVRLTFSGSGIRLEMGGTVYEAPATKVTGLATLIFGVNDVPALQTVDCPPFTLRDIKIGFGEGYRHHWPADEIAGSTLHDALGDRPLKAVNAEWLAAQTFHWKPIGEMNGEMSLAVSHDPIRQRVLWAQPGGIQSFGLTNGYATNFDLSLDVESRFGLFNPLIDQLITYDMEPVGVAQFRVDTTAQLITEKPNPRSPIQNLWLSASFVNPLDSQLMLLGGYGFFTSKNTLWTYDHLAEEWSLVPLQGDTLAPRYHLAVAAGPKAGQCYVFGGIGNLTGKQELGLQHYYDLFLLDLNDSTLQKVWELPEVEAHFSVVDQMVFSEAEQALYVLGYRAFGEVNNLALLKLDVKEPAVQVVGDSIPFIQRGFDRTQAGLFQNELTGELIAYTIAQEVQQARLQLFSMLFPPQPVPAIKGPSFLGRYGLGVVLLCAGLLVAVVWRRRAKGRTHETRVQPIREADKDVIRLWGGFTVFDAAGADVSDQFSPKIKELFLLLFFHSVGEARGIKAQKIYEKVWPGHERAKAKNALGVTMGRLRTALQPVDSLQVVNEQGAWKLEWKSQVPTDYHLTMLSLDQLQDHFSEEILSGLIKVVARGPFLPNTDIEWLDDYKGKVNFRVTSSLMAISEKVSEAPRQVNIADVILSIDDLHEQAARLKITALTTLGKHGLANDFYAEFAKRYQELYQEAFPSSFKEMCG